MRHAADRAFDRPGQSIEAYTLREVLCFDAETQRNAETQRTATIQLLTNKILMIELIFFLCVSQFPSTSPRQKTT